MKASCETFGHGKQIPRRASEGKHGENLWEILGGLPATQFLGTYQLQPSKMDLFFIFPSL